VAFDLGAFSADGEVAFIGVDDDNQPRVGTADGGKPRGVSAKGIEPTDFAWMPDGKSLLISDRSPDGSGDRLVVYDLSGKRLRVVPTKLRFQAGNGMAVRPDGKVAVVAAQEPSDFDIPSDLVEVDLSTGGSRNLTSTPDLAEELPVYVDNETLVFSAGKIVGLTQGPNGWIGVLDVGSGAVRRLTPDDQAAGSAAVVGGGSAVVYDAFPPPNRDQQALWWVPLSGGQPTMLFPLDGRRPASFANSNTILYAKTGTVGGRAD
jgi:hypothetical protein